MDVFGLLDHRGFAARMAQGANHLGMLGVAEDDEVIPFADQLFGLVLHQGNEWAGGIYQGQALALGLLVDLRRHPVGANDHRAARAISSRESIERTPFVSSDRTTCG